MIVKYKIESLFVSLSIVLLLSLPAREVHAQPARPASATTPATPPASAAADWVDQSGGRRNANHQSEESHADDENREDDESREDDETQDHRHSHHDDSVINLGSNSQLRAGEEADSVVAIFGSSSSDGVADDVGAVFGSARATGPVKDSVFAVFGNVYVDGPVGDDVVAVFGNVELGPHAEVQGDVSAVFGKVSRDPSALVLGHLNSVGAVVGGFTWLQPWIDHCLLYGRPLAFVSGIAWAWGLALGLLVVYLSIALLFPAGVIRCVETLESEPGTSVVAALLMLLLIPIAIFLLCITLIGVGAIPFLILGLFCLGLFGKAVMLAWIGRRCLRARGPQSALHTALAVLIGAAVAIVLYLIPVLGFIVYKLLGVLGFGVVAYTLLTMARARHAAPGGRAFAGATLTGEVTAGGGIGMAAGGATSGGATGGSATSGGATGGSATGGSATGGGATGSSGGAGPTALGAAPLVTAALPRAGFWIRMAALVIDALLVGALLGVVYHHGSFFLVMLALYGAIMWKLRGSTVGGIIFDLQVVRLDDRPIGWETAIVRALGCFLSLIVIGLGFLWIVLDHGKQAWHDKIAGTVVVRVPRGSVSLV